MPNDDPRVGYRKPPVGGRFQKGKSGNPRGRPKKASNLANDAVEIFGAKVAAKVRGKPVKMSAAQAMFRSLCRKALKGDNAALRRAIDLVLTLGFGYQLQAEQNDNRRGDIKRRLLEKLGIDPNDIDHRPQKTDPRAKERRKRLEAMVKAERKRLMREAQRDPRR